LRQGLQQSDLPAIIMAAHALKGSCLSVAALQLAAHCRRMETAANEGRLADAATCLPELEASSDALIAALQPYLTQA
jgi:HPt (histidine-containing phosphotransfer) domain-containing protein